MAATFHIQHTHLSPFVLKAGRPAMNRIAMIAVASAFLAIGGVAPAIADDCSGHDHDTGTAVGAVGGAAIGGLASHSIVGAVVGGVVGGVAGNAIARDQDCDHQAAEDRARDQAYNDDYADRAAQDDRVRRENEGTVYREPGDN
jgi:hypothetical protein